MHGATIKIITYCNLASNAGYQIWKVWSRKSLKVDFAACLMSDVCLTVKSGMLLSCFFVSAHGISILTRLERVPIIEFTEPTSSLANLLSLIKINIIKL